MLNWLNSIRGAAVMLLAIIGSSLGDDETPVRRYPLYPVQVPVRRRTSALDAPLLQGLPPVGEEAELLPPVQSTPEQVQPRPPSPPPVPRSGLEALENSIGDSAQQIPMQAGCGAHRLPYFREDFGDDPICY